VPVYLFRDRNRATTFAYSTDVTGRNLARQTSGSWEFVTVVSNHEITQGEDAMRYLRHRGYYVFDK